MDLPALCSKCGKAIMNPTSCHLCGAIVCEQCHSSHKHDSSA